MAMTIRRVSYFYTTALDQPGEAYKLLSALADAGVKLLAFTAVPVGPMRTQLTLFPEDSPQLVRLAALGRVSLDGPHQALLVQGDDELGALAHLHEKLYDAGVNVYASSGVTDGRGAFGYIIYVKHEQYQDAVKALDVR